MLALLYSFIVHVVNPNLKLWSLYEVIYGFFAFTPNVFIPHMHGASFRFGGWRVGSKVLYLEKVSYTIWVFLM